MARRRVLHKVAALVMTTRIADKGAFSALLHFLLGALFGAVIFGTVIWFIFAPPFFIQPAIAGAVVFGAAAAIWRGRFWTALANNPLFQAWRALNGRR